MAIISLDPEKEIDYIPECDRDSKDPCVVTVKYVPYSKVQEYSKMLNHKIKDSTKQTRIMAAGREMQAIQWGDNVVKISNYFIEDREITDPSEFYEVADTDLIAEILKAMESMTKLTEGQRKNFKGQSGTHSSAEKKAPLLTAANVQSETKNNVTVKTDED